MGVSSPLPVWALFYGLVGWAVCPGCMGFTACSLFITLITYKHKPHAARPCRGFCDTCPMRPCGGCRWPSSLGCAPS
jgi:hypothetical protein